MRTTLKFNDHSVQRSLSRLIEAGTDPSPLMQRLANHLADATDESFEREAAADGTPWEPLAAVTQAALQRTGHVSIQILQQRGDLAKSITSS